MNPRRKARELALQALFQFDVQGEPFAEELASFLKDSCDQIDIRDFARRLAEGAWANRAEADELLNKLTVRWSVERMAATDRNILRLGIFQLLHLPDIPPRVVINEAIELGKRYSTQDSAQFINGLLDAVNKQQPRSAQCVMPNAQLDEGPPEDDAEPEPEAEEDE